VGDEQWSSVLAAPYIKKSLACFQPYDLQSIFFLQTFWKFCYCFLNYTQYWFTSPAVDRDHGDLRELSQEHKNI